MGAWSVIRFSYLSLGLCAAVLSFPAQARDWPSTAGWDIVEGDTFCGMMMDYDGKGSTQLLIGKNLDGSATVIVTNYGWSAQKGEKYDLSFHLDQHVFGPGKALGTGESYERKGFIARFGTDFFPALASASGFKAYLGETVVDNLSLRGSSAALAKVDQCLASVRAVTAAAERERQRFAYIPDDPFAGKSTTAPPPANSSAWVTTDDYPPSAIRSGEEGTTVVAFTVNGAGRVENCRVTTSSGSTALDQATCRAVTRRGRYTPSPETSGKPTSVEKSLTFTWKLPS